MFKEYKLEEDNIIVYIRAISFEHNEIDIDLMWSTIILICIRKKEFLENYNSLVNDLV